MANSVLLELIKAIKETENNQKLEIDELVDKIRELPQFSRTPISVLKINIKKYKESLNETNKNKTGNLSKRDQPDISQSGVNSKTLKFDNNESITLESLGGMKKEKNLLKRFVKTNILNKEMFDYLNCTKRPKNLLIAGPPGCGKTSLAIATLNHAGLNYLRLSLFDSRISQFLIDGRPQQFVKLLKGTTPCGIIFDDLDHFFGDKEGAKDSGKKSLYSFLTLLDELRNEEAIILGTASKPEKLPQSFLQGGRFENKITVNMPDEVERADLLFHFLNHLPKEAINYEELILATAGYVVSDLQALFSKACEIAIDEYLDINPEQKPSLQQIHFIKALSFIKPLAKHEGFQIIPETTWEDIGALSDLKSELDRLIIKPIRHPNICNQYALRRTAGVLLYGPPGCGKTLLAKAVANSCKANFIYVKGPELLSKYVGESEKAVRGLFARARVSSPCLIFFDEIDGLCPKRGTDGNQVIERVVNQLLTEMNGVEELTQIYLIGATNRPDIIDRAILRPERLGVHLYVPLPSKNDQVEILKTIMKKKPINPELSSLEVSTNFNLDRYSGADLNALVEGAARNAAWNNNSKGFISLSDFTIAYSKMKPSIAVEDLIYYNNLKASFS